MENRSSTLLNSSKLSSTQFNNRHNVLRGRFSPRNMSSVWFINSVKFSYLDIFYSTRNSLGVSSVEQQESGVLHV
jgi:hypothetical protein